MDKKTIGSFIAILRKANGMTQQQLADRVNVSNKTVSRWERDESLPDLTLIPVLAEIFELTSDELLKGERDNNKNVSEKPFQKTQIQIKYILDRNLTKFQVLSIISLSLVVTGLIIMLVCGYGFYQAILGFGLAVAFFLASIISEIIFTTYAIAAANAEEFEGNQLYSYRHSIIKYLNAVIFCNIIAFCLCAPFIIFRSSTYINSILIFQDWIKVIPICLIISIIINLIVGNIITKVIYQRQSFLIGEKENILQSNHNRLKKKFLVILGLTLAITMCTKGILSNSNYPQLFVKGQTFESFEKFKEFIETPVERPVEPVNNDFAETIVGQDAVVASSKVISEPISKMRFGDIEYVYYHRNKSVSTIVNSYNSNTEERTIKTYSYDDIRKEDKIRHQFNVVFKIIYLFEVIVILYFYIKNRRKLYS